MSPSVYLEHLDNLIAGKDGGTGEGSVLVTQERTTDADGAKVTAKKEAEKSSNADKNKVDEKRESENHALF